MSLLRQGRHYFLIGVLQYVVDCSMTIALSHFGLAVELANVAGRVSGATLGFWLNGRITFASDDTRVGRRQLGRFVLMWLLMTALSTLAIGGVENAAGLKWAWVAKPVIEVLLAGVSFVLSRQWVYRA
ncbi:GtrA family protein [Lysobacter fragariae]